MNNFLKIGLAAAGAFVYTLLDGRKLATRRGNSALAKGKRFVVVGGGFAGVEAAAGLVKQLSTNDSSAQVVLIDQRGYLLFTPMLTEAVGAKIKAHHIIVPLQSFSKRIRVVTGQVKEIDMASKSVKLEGETITADYLILALGANSNFHGIQGVEQAAYTLKSLEDARGIRGNALEMLKQASKEPDSGARRPMLTFVVAGGGYTGVEAIAALNEMIRERARDYPALDGTPIRMILAEPLDRLMTEVTSDLASYSQKQLENAGVEIKLHVGIKKVDGDEIELTNGEHIRAKTLIWTAGVEANPLVSKLGAPTGKLKAVKVDQFLEVRNANGVWAVGDCAEVPEADTGKSYSQTAQNATREGKLVARNIFRELRGEELKAFRYKPIGQLALVGRRKGVAQIYGFNFSGLIAYLMWRAIYIAKVPSMAQRVRVISDWVLDVTLGPVAEYRAVPVPSRDQRFVEAQR